MGEVALLSQSFASLLVKRFENSSAGWLAQAPPILIFIRVNLIHPWFIPFVKLRVLRGSNFLLFYQFTAIRYQLSASLDEVLDFAKKDSLQAIWVENGLIQSLGGGGESFDLGTLIQ